MAGSGAGVLGQLTRAGRSTSAGCFVRGIASVWPYPMPSEVGSNRSIDLEVSCSHLEDAVNTARLVVVASFAAAVMSGCTTIAQAPSDLQGTNPTGAERRECERNGGYWVTAAAYCRIGA
jgi:hypothetical protein